MNEHKTFHYTYSAKRNQEIESIRQKYLPKEENKMELLKKLDNAVTVAGTMESLIVGILGCLVFGAGLCFMMHIIGSSPLPGIPLEIVGAIAIGAAYPLYRKIKNNKKKELTPRILALTEELMNK